MCFVVDSGEKCLVTYSRNQLFRVWELPEGRCVKHFKVPQAVVLDMDIQHNLIVTGTSDRVVCVFDYVKGFSTHFLRGHKGMITKVMFHPIPEKLQVFASSVDNTIRMWDLLLNSCITVLGHASPCSTFEFSQDGNSLIAAYRDKRIIVWDLLSRAKSSSFQLDEEIEAMHYIYKNKTPLLVTFGDRGVPRILALNTKVWAHVCPHEAQPFLRCIYIKKTQHLVAVTNEQNLIVYSLRFDADKSPCIQHVCDHIGFHDEIIDAALCPGHLVLATNSALLK